MNLKRIMFLVFITTCLILATLTVSAAETDEYLPGDVNYDGLVNTTDVVILRRYIAGGYGIDLTPPSTKCDHKEELDPAVSPTCTTTGLTEGSHCSVCDEVLKKQEVIPSKGHSFTDGVCSDCGIMPATSNEYYVFKQLQDGNYSIAVKEDCNLPSKLFLPSTYNDRSVTVIAEDAFWGCRNLENVIIPDSVTKINSYSFSGCNSLSDIQMPDSVTEIGEFAFEGCSKLTSITISEGISNIGRGAFSGCTSVMRYFVGSNNSNYREVEGNLYNKSGSVLLNYACAKAEKSFVIPDHVAEIEMSAFQGCTSLESITIPNNVQKMDMWVFKDCTGLTAVKLPDGLRSIQGSMFMGCTALKEITIPGSVTSIMGSVIQNCTALEKIYFGGTMAQWEAIDKVGGWDYRAGDYVVHCTDGDILP